MNFFGFIRSLLMGDRGTALPDPVPPAVERHPLWNTRDEAAYRAALAEVLASRSEHAVAALKGAFGQMPDTAKHLEIMVHPNQEPDGLFSVMIHLDGPDLFVLNKAIEPHRSLFTSRLTRTSTEPLLPTFDPFDAGFSVNDAIVDVAADWVEALWRDAGGAAFALTATVSGEDGYGATTPRRLSSAVK